ncbi:hypothetical protein ACIBQX_11705 [Nonomuraea sp. NPDC049714]|uniref:hypothetical protein n=1 Tax=Nonomuraea sp. NPDC049714 TaxID=3364357 RepID=UPI0037A59271
MNDITPERIAEHLRGSEVFENRALAGFVDVACEGAVLRIGFTPKGKPSQIERFCAVVVEGETVPDPAEVEQLKARLEAAEGVMWQALAQPTHEVARHLLALYLGAVNPAQAEQDGGQADV